MGYTGTFAKYYKKDGKIDLKKEGEEYLSGTTSDNRTYGVIKSVLTGSTLYAALAFKDVDGHILYVMGCVLLMRVQKNEILFKEVLETSGPCERDCPASILNLLTPTTDECAIVWRNDCLANLSKNRIVQKQKSKLRDLGVGSIIEFVVDFNNTTYEKGTKIKLQKRQYGDKEIWWDGYYRWRPSLIPLNYMIIEERK